jgi:long-chain fatty acid transport protein
MHDSYPCSRASSTIRRSLTGAIFGSAAFLAVFSLARTSEASGFLGARFGADHGNPVNPTPYAIYYNPAALAGGLKGTQATLDASVVLRRASYTRSTAALSPTPGGGIETTPDYQAANTGKASLTNVLALPFVGIASDFGGSKLAAGFAVYVPFGGLANWGKNDSFKGSQTAPGAVDGQQRWQSISGVILATYATAAVAYRVHPRISIGMNASAVWHHLSTIRARNANNSDDTVGGPSSAPTKAGYTAEGRSFVEADAITPAIAFGIWARPTDDLTLGASLSIRPGFGEFRLKGKIRQQFGGGVAEDPPTDADVLQTFPDVLRLGGAYRVSDQLELRLDGDFVTWSNFKRQCIVNKGGNCEINADGSQTASSSVIVNIPREWKNAFGVRAGAGYWLSPDLELFGSAMYDASAVPKETLDPTFMDAPKVIGTIGARKAFGRAFALAASFTHVQYLPVDTKGANNFYDRAPPTQSPSADGKYTQTYDLINLNGTYSF